MWNGLKPWLFPSPPTTNVFFNSALLIDASSTLYRDALCLQYVSLRAVDTVEDDMTIPQDIKKTMLTSFDKYLQDVTWKYTDSKDEYAVVLEQFPCVTLAIAELSSKYRSIVLELVIGMGHTLIPFVGKEYITMEDINEYCGAIGGFFWIGSARLFAASGLEANTQDTSLIKLAGLLIQKTNIIRDFRKDWISGRLFYPKDLWSRYVNSPGDFLKLENFDKGVECVNELVTAALDDLIPYLSFLETLRSPDAIKFFGIHQVVTAATLERCYNNPRVFTESVKIERGATSKIMNTITCLTDIVDKVGDYVNKIKERALQKKETSQSTLQICQKILDELELFQANKESMTNPSA